MENSDRKEAYHLPIPFQGLHDKRPISRPYRPSNRVKKINREIRRFGEPGDAGNTVPRADLDNLELTYGAETYMPSLGLAGSNFVLNLQIAYHPNKSFRAGCYAFIHAAFHDFRAPVSLALAPDCDAIGICRFSPGLQYLSELS